MKFRRFTEIMRIDGVPVYAHWTLLAIGIVILVAAFHRPAETFAAWGAYSFVILLHECGHMIAARRRRCAVDSIELYPIHGVCRFEQPWSRYDHAVIAWGGVAAQAAVATPLVAYIAVFGFTPFEALNVAIGILSYYSLAIAVFNLLPIPGLDGRIAWSLVPELLKRLRNRGNGRRPVARYRR